MSGVSLEWTDAWLAQERLPASYRHLLENVWLPLSRRIAARANAVSAPLRVALCGAQGSGKSTAAAALARLLLEQQVPTAVLSIDDFYYTRTERERLARDVHPLLLTRGVPGTHDVELARRVIGALHSGERPPLPRFDKARDDRVAPDQWRAPPCPPRAVILEGWCVGARPQPPEALVAPLNPLERDEDPSGIWRGYVNAALAGPYRPLFESMDMLVLLAAPSFEVVYRWRLEQEHKLRERLAREGGDATRVMDDAQVSRFIAHYERVTRHILAEMPARADVLLRLDAARRVLAGDAAGN